MATRQCMPERPGSRRGCRVACGLLCLLGACTDNPYPLGHYDAVPDASVAPDPCADSSALFCSSFESSDLGEWDGTTVTGEGTVDRSTERHHGGSAALRATSAGPDTTAVVARSLPPRSSGTLYLRAHLFVASGQATETMNLFFLGREPNPSDSGPFVGLDVNLLDGRLQVYSPQAEPARRTGELEIPRDVWFCLGLEVELDGTGRVRAYAGETLMLDAADFTTRPEGGVILLRAGIDWSSEQTATFEVFIDDLVLDSDADEGRCPIE